MQIFTWKDITSSIENKKSISFFSNNNGTGLSVGSFDGLHLGHRALLKTLVQNCAELNLLPGVISFSRPLPGIKHSEDYSGDVSSLSQRIKLFEKLGIQFAIIIDFNEGFASLRGTDFLNLLIKACNMKFIAEGVDFRFGYKGAADVPALKYFAQENNIGTSFVEQIIYKDGTEKERVSSSYIRTMISKGFLSTVKELLLRPYEIDMESIQFYTEKNKLFVLKSDIKQVLPPDGTYFCTGQENQEIKVNIADDKIFVSEKSTSLMF